MWLFNVSGGLEPNDVGVIVSSESYFTRTFQIVIGHVVWFVIAHITQHHVEILHIEIPGQSRLRLPRK